MSAAPPPRIVCIGFISKKNSPLHIQSFPPAPQPPLSFHFLLHTTLDIFASRLPHKSNGDSDFGLLYAVDERLSCYGWLTNTAVKIVVVVEGGGVRDGELKSVFRDLQTAYIRLVCNPFYDEEETAGRMVQSKRFEKEVRRIAEAWRAAGAGAGAAAG